MPDLLTPRQARERSFYDEYARGVAPGVITADPLAGAQSRPWNPGWYAYGIVRELHQRGARTILDLGCGTGASAVRLARIGYTVTGVDVSAGCLAVAAENAHLNGVAERVRLEAGTAESLPFPDQSFDAVVGFDILHHVEVGPAVRECLRVLKPGGTAVFKEWVEVPVLDRLRHMPPFRWLFRRAPSVSREVTADERKLSARDLGAIAALHPGTTVVRFRLLARLHRIVKPAADQPSLWERMDAVLFRVAPAFRRLGGAGVVVLRKPSAAV